VVTRAVLAAAALLTLLRFVDLSTAPFIHDEPVFQMLIDDHLAAGTLPTHALVGNKGIAYGPTALWIYYPLRLLTDDVGIITAFHVLLHALGMLLLFLAVRASVDTATAAWVWLLTAASPYLFFYARLPWDNTFLVPLIGLLALLLVRLEQQLTRLGSWLGLGVVCALLFDLHLMAVPVIGAAGLAVLPALWRARRGARPWVGLLLAALAMLAVMFPYLRVIAGSLGQGSQLALTREALGHALPETFLGTGLYLSSRGMDYFFDPTTPLITGVLGPLAAAEPLAWVVRVTGWGWLAWCGVRLFRSRQPILVRFGVALFVLLLLYYYAVRPYPLHPHYFMSAFWLLPFFAALALRELARPLAWALSASMVLLVVANLAFVLGAHHFVARDRGTRGLHYGSTAEQLRAATAELCAAARARGGTVQVDLTAVPGVFPPSLRFYARHLETCRGARLTFGSAPDAARLGYADSTPTDARLVVTLP
jgi:Dolichyl-phosphate-mannose-protein mannosyltransferase